ncbi:LysM peptidoglycan-binding domain-containing protein, partial [Staphylococcus aureus]
YYTVQAGDSLSLIASKYGTTYQNIMRLKWFK